MSLSGFIGGSKNKTNSASMSSSNSQVFSDEVLKALESNFLESLSDYDTYKDYTKEMVGKVMSGEAYDVAPIIAENTRRTEQQIGQSYQSLARQAGSDANSLVAAAQSQASADAYSALAKTSAELEMEAMGQQIADLGAALGTGEQGLSSVLGLGYLLKGGKTKSSSFSTGTQSSSGMEWGVSGNTGK